MNDLTRRSALKGIGSIALITAGVPAARAAGHKWDFTIYYGPGHPLTLLYKALVDDIRKKTNGELDITLRVAGELPFKATEAVSVCGRGQVEMALGYMGFIAGTTRIAAMPGLPFLIREPDEAEKSMKILMPYIEKTMARQGVKPLLWNGQYWPQNIFGRGKPMTSLEDFKGRSARGSSPEQGDIIRTYGGTPTTLTTAEVPEAMNRGVINIVFTGAANIVGSKWTEFLEWAYPCIPNTGIEYVMINQHLYEGLSPKLRGILDETVAENRPKMWAALKKVNDKSETFLRTKLKFADVKPDDIKRYEAKFTPYWANWAKSAGPDSVEALKKIRAALGK